MEQSQPASAFDVDELIKNYKVQKRRATTRDTIKVSRKSIQIDKVIEAPE